MHFLLGEKKCHTIKYKIAVCISDGKIVWINGPYSGKVYDKTMLKDGSFCDQLLNDELVLADKGYQDYSLVFLF